MHINKINKKYYYSCIQSSKYFITIMQYSTLNYSQTIDGLTDKCGPGAVHCWKKSVNQKCSFLHSATIVCTKIANLGYL